MKDKRTCKFCDKPINNIAYIGSENRQYSCGECSCYCMKQCKEVLKTSNSWHKEPCVSCGHNPYVKLHKWNGKEWVRENEQKM